MSHVRGKSTLTGYDKDARPMRGKSVGEQVRVPVHINDVEKVTNALIVDPENAVVKHLRTLGVEIECTAHFWRPVHSVQFRVVSFPPQMRPRVLQHQQSLSLEYYRYVNGGFINAN